MNLNLIVFIVSNIFFSSWSIQPSLLPKPIIELYEHYATNPDDSSLKYQLGNALLNLGNIRFEENNLESALEIFQELADMFPSSAAIYHNLGYTLAELNRPHDAINAYQHALCNNPDNSEIHFCASTAYLATHDYIKGFTEYEWRWKSYNALANSNVTIWYGEDLHGKTILLRSEGSLGDVLQFVRFAQIVKELGATVIVQTFTCLIPILSLCPYIDQLISHAQPIPPIDYQQSLMSLPFVFKITYETVPNKPYLYADQTLITKWAHLIKANTTDASKDENTIHIGICWQADPGNDTNRPLLARRSVPLHLFEKLAQIPNVKLYSLQARDGIEQANRHTWLHTFEDLDTAHGSFMDSAAIMQHLDLIISVDTSVAHLAGALGHPVWLLLPYKADWRWGWQSELTSWYPTMRIFRALGIGSWDLVIDCVYNQITLEGKS